MPPSVLHVSRPTTEGVARCVADLVAAQRTRGWDVAVACPRDGWLAEAVVESGAEHFEWEARRAPGARVRSEAARLARIVEVAGPDTVHLYSSKAGLAGRLAVRRRLPTLFEPQAWSFEVGGPVAPLARVWERWGARWTDLLVCCASAELAAGRAAGVRGEAAVVPNAVNLTEFSPAGPEERSGARARLGLGGGPLVVCVGRLSKQKGQDLLLDAWPAVRAVVPVAELVLVGDGPDRETLTQRSVTGVRIVGNRRDVADWLAASDVVTVPSRYDGLSFVLLEAMARARPIVAHAAGGVAETLAPDDDTAGGAVVAVGDTRALAAAIAERLVAPDLAEAEGRAGRVLVEKNNDLARRTDRLCAITERVRARRSRGDG